jgi:acyl-CoA thioesterase I
LTEHRNFAQVIFSTRGKSFIVRNKFTPPMAGLITGSAMALMLCLGPASGADAPRKTIVVLGDSIAAGSGVEPTEAFPSLLQEKIQEKQLPYAIVNAGVSGDTTASGLRRMPWLLKRPIDILVIELGGNDGLRGIAPEETRANIEKIISLAREKNSNIRIVLAGMQMPQNMGEDYNRKFRALFSEVAKERKTALVPFLLEGVGGKAELNQPDRIHPNPAGHKIVAENVWSVLHPLLTSAGSSEERTSPARP